jgi:hypothetical protein
MPEPEGADVTTPPGETPQTPPASAGVSQEEVSRIAAREKDQGARAERRRILTALGLDPETGKLEDVTATLTAAREADAARLSEAERREKAATDAEARAVAREQQAAQTTHRARLTEALVRAGSPGETLDDARTLLSTVPADADDAALTEAVNALKTRLPALFGVQQQTPPPLPSGGGHGTPPRPQPTGDAYERGRERARAMGLAPAAP